MTASGLQDTFKEKQMLEDMYARGKTPWEVWSAPHRKKRIL
jgi:glucose-1-phosphate cytidylyltransferase